MKFNTLTLMTTLKCEIFKQDLIFDRKTRILFIQKASSKGEVPKSRIRDTLMYFNQLKFNN